MSEGLFGKLPAWEDQFLAFWAQGIFRKLGKTEARRRLRTSIKTEDDWKALYEAHEAYKADLKRNPRHLMHGSTFASQWKDFLELEDTTEYVRESRADRLVREQKAASRALRDSLFGATGNGLESGGATGEASPVPARLKGFKFESD